MSEARLSVEGVAVDWIGRRVVVVVVIDLTG